jgi:hypothetical protein
MQKIMETNTNHTSINHAPKSYSTQMQLIINYGTQTQVTPAQTTFQNVTTNECNLQ